MGEMLEHVDNPVDFLTKTSNILREWGFKGKYVITVPNAFSLQRGIYLKGIEGINSDHKYWFTPYTICKVLMDAGLKPKELTFAEQGAFENANNRIEKVVFKIWEYIHKEPVSVRAYRGGGVLLYLEKMYIVMLIKVVIFTKIGRGSKELLCINH